jgi:N-acyl-D-amino-acid deacylase
MGMAAGLSAQIPDFTPPTPLMGAVLQNDKAAVSSLLESGADPNEARFLGAPALVLALMQQNAGMARALIGKGADVKAIDGAGSTTLMWAAASESAQVEMVEELLKRGVDPNIANKKGETALTWALRRGYTPVTETLKKYGASDRAMIRESVEKALGLLQKSGPEFVKVSGCTSCHHQSLPQMAYGLARQRGFAVDPVISQKQAKAVIAMFSPYKEQMMQGKQNIPDPAISVSYSLIGLGAEGYSRDATTDAMAHLVSTQQRDDGSFRTFAARPPIESSVVTATALSLRALQLYGNNTADRVERARKWLQTAKVYTNEERAMQLMGLVWAKCKPEELKTAALILLSQQREDGGWAQSPGLESDAYATGQALVALRSAAQVSTTDRTYERGIAFLLRTRQPDGSWFVRTRSFPFQPYKESGFPHGKDQWISAAGTSWATMALALTVPEIQQVSQVQ